MTGTGVHTLVPTDRRRGGRRGPTRWTAPTPRAHPIETPVAVTQRRNRQRGWIFGPVSSRVFRWSETLGIIGASQSGSNRHVIGPFAVRLTAS